MSNREMQDFFFEVSRTAHNPMRGFMITADDDSLYGVRFVLDQASPTGTAVDMPGQAKPNSVHQLVCRQILAYLAGDLFDFELPLQFIGTSFQQSVWRAMRNIPYGETLTYKEVATAVGNSNSCRAVGQAANKNPIPVIVPCHRVVGSRGALTGFAYGVDTKAFLLDHERLHAKLMVNSM